MPTLHLLDRTGDTRHEWDPKSPAEVAIAREAFDKAKRNKMLIYKIDAKGNRELIREFDATAERIICTPQTVGG